MCHWFTINWQKWRGWKKGDREKKTKQTEAARWRSCAFQGDQLFRCNGVNHTCYLTTSILLIRENKDKTKQHHSWCVFVHDHIHKCKFSFLRPNIMHVNDHLCISLTVSKRGYGLTFLSQFYQKRLKINKETCQNETKIECIDSWPQQNELEWL